MMIHTTIGVYSNESIKTNGVACENLAEHIVHNQRFRPGRALFVDGVCINQGYLTDEQIERITIKIKDVKHDKDTVPYH